MKDTMLQLRSSTTPLKEAQDTRSPVLIKTYTIKFCVDKRSIWKIPATYSPVGFTAVYIIGDAK